MQVNVRVGQIACFLTSSIILADSGLAAREPISVTVKPLAEVAEFPSRTEPATVVSLNDSRLSSEITAVIVDIPVQVGQVVEADTPLVRLDRTDIELALKRGKAILLSLEARHRLAKTQLEWAQVLASKGSLSKEELLQRETSLQISEAEIAAQHVFIAQTQRNLNKTVIRAPFRGIVMERLGHSGELAGPGSPLIRIIDMEEVQLLAKLQPQYIESLKSAGSVEFTSQGGLYAVVLHGITPALERRERSQEVRFRFTEKLPLVGSTGHLVWRQRKPHVPADLLVRRGGALGVFIVAGERARFIALGGAQEGQPAQVDLLSDTAVIVKGRFLLSDEDAITVVSP